MAKVDAGQHIPLIHRVINQMGFEGTDREEAFSEGLVAITEAAIKYDPSKNVPVASWLARNIRWSLINWRNSQRQTYQLEDVETPKDSLTDRVELLEALFHVNQLPPIQRQIILATARGIPGKRIAESLGITEVAVSRAKKKAQEKLRELLK